MNGDYCSQECFFKCKNALPQLNSDPSIDPYAPKEFLVCPTCGSSFKPTQPYQLGCETCKGKIEEKFEENSEKKYKRKCIHCNLYFRAVNIVSREKVCYTCKRQRGKEAAQTLAPSRADLFLKEKKKRKGINYAKAIEKMEYERVYGKGAWDHYCKGRKWDKI